MFDLSREPSAGAGHRGAGSGGAGRDGAPQEFLYIAIFFFFQNSEFTSCNSDLILILSILLSQLCFFSSESQV